MASDLFFGFLAMMLLHNLLWQISTKETLRQSIRLSTLSCDFDPIPLAESDVIIEDLHQEALNAITNRASTPIRMTVTESCIVGSLFEANESTKLLYVEPNINKKSF